MAKKKKSRADLAAENRLLRQQNAYMAVASVVNNLIRWGGLVAIAYCAMLAIRELAGKSTWAGVVFDMGSGPAVSITLAWTFGLSGIGYGWRQRNLRKQNIASLEGHIRKLEVHFDPDRSTSGLTERGDTHPEDES